LPGGVVVAAVKEIPEKTWVAIKYRVRYNTNFGVTQSNHTRQFDFLTVGASAQLKGRGGASELWTFAGGAANAVLCPSNRCSLGAQDPAF
jgi:hypothetical protein